MTVSVEKDERIEQARALLVQLEAGNEAEAEKILAALGASRENPLFREIGRLTRELHEAIASFLLDERIVELASHEIPDASERLNYVISMTEKSANTTLSAVEEGLPLADELGKKAQKLSVDWERFQGRELSLKDFRELSHELAMFLQLTRDHTAQLHGHLSDVLMAQDFQDLTGQIIRQVIALIQDVEGKLVQLVRISGASVADTPKDANKLEGPVIPGVEQGDVVSGQDDVDDLLSSLGF